MAFIPRSSGSDENIDEASNDRTAYPKCVTLRAKLAAGASAKLLPLAFYSNRQFQPTTIETIQTDKNIRYALVTEREAALMGRPVERRYEIKGQWSSRGDYTVLTFPPPNTTRSSQRADSRG